MIRWVVNSASLGFSLLCYAMVLFIGGPLVPDQALDAVLLTGLASLSLLSVLLLCIQNRPLVPFAVLGLKLAISLLIGIPLQIGDGREELIYYALFADCLLFLPDAWGIAFAALSLMLTIINQHEWKAWETVVPQALPAALLAYGTRLALVLFLAIGIRLAFLAYQHKFQQWKHLDNSIQSIMEANLQLQGYAVQVERQTTEAERKRITREIHDIIGYSLTNQLMVLEASILLVDSNPAALKDTLVEARRQLQDGLGDIRRELYELRSAEISSRTSLSELHYLCRIFQEATGVQVRLELAMQSNQLEPMLFHCLYRIIQQGLTNSFFHGRASLVEVCINEYEGVLHMTIIDNGFGILAKTSEDKPGGIGLTGMAERIDAFGGRLSHNANPGGFQLNIEVPLDRAGTETV